MLNRPYSSSKPPIGYEYEDRPYAASHAHGNSDETTIDFDRLFAAVRRQFWVIVCGAGFGIALGVAYVLTSQPLYTASSQILIDDRSARAFEDATAPATGVYDSVKLDSQVELLKSEKIGLAVVESLDLVNDRAFMQSGSSTIKRVMNDIRSFLDVTKWFSQTVPVSVDPSVQETEIARKKRSANGLLLHNLTASRVGRTYVLNISYTSANPNQAAKIANAVAEAYLVDQLDAKYDATRRASEWMQTRIQELRGKSLETDLAVQKFRSENNLIATGGELIGEQQLGEVSSQLIVARAATAEAEARYRRISDIIDSGQVDAAVTEALSNPVIGQLRSKFLEASKRHAEISRKLGEDHIQAIKFKNEMGEFQRVIFDELGRIAQSYRSDFEIQKSRERSLTTGLAALVGETANTNEVLVNLRELERESETYKNLYQSFLQRFQETVQKQSFPITEARIITQARQPGAPSHPRKSLVLAMALVLGGMGGLGFGVLREFRDRGLRTGDQVRERLGLEFLGLLPDVDHKMIRVADPANDVDAEPGAATGQGTRAVLPIDSIMRQVLDNPASGFSEALRSAKIAADLMLADRTSKIIGTVSAFPREGKSTVSKNFASLLANLGARTLLIDCDLRNPGLTRAVAPHAETGLLEALLEDKPFQSLLFMEPESKLFILPAVISKGVTHTGDLLASPSMTRLLQSASEAFDYIIVDLPPLAPVVDVRGFANQFDAFLLVVEWGKTPRQAIRTVLENDSRIREKCLGVVLNKVDIKRQKMYESHHVDGYHYSSYTDFYK